MCGRINSMMEELVDSIGMPVIEKEKLMNSRRKIMLHLLLYMTLCGPAFAQVVQFPDPNLRAAVAEAIGVDPDRITMAVLRQLTRIDAVFREIESLEGLQHVTNLSSWIWRVTVFPT